MQPLPDWLYRRYARLYDYRGEESWVLADAMGLWGDGEGRANAVVSELRKRGHVVVMAREGRVRRYRLVSPGDFLFSFVHLPSLELVKAEAYRPMIVKAVRGLKEGLGTRLVSVGLFGSVARGTPTKTSDVDLYVVGDWESMNKSRRLDEVFPCLRTLDQERVRLLNSGLATDASVYPVSREEAVRFHSLHLDLSVEGIVLYDPTGFLSQAWARLRVWLERKGAERVQTGETWFWRLDPGLEVGSRV
jgi:predicted nucleotidyltransferase